VLVGIDQHLLHGPAPFVLGEDDVGVPCVARFRVETNVLVFGVIGFELFAELLRRPHLALGFFQRTEM
jgi:hypothetical protein